MYQIGMWSTISELSIWNLIETASIVEEEHRLPGARSQSSQILVEWLGSVEDERASCEQDLAYFVKEVGFG